MAHIKTVNEMGIYPSAMSNEDRASELFGDVLETEGYEYIDGLVSQIEKVFNFSNAGVFDDDVHEAIDNAVRSLVKKYKVK